MISKEWRSPIVVLVAGALIVNLSMGIRHAMGLFQKPMVMDIEGLTRSSYSFAIAVQNIMWGVSSIFFGMLADKYGAGKVLAGSCVLYALGLWGMSVADSSLMLTLTGGVLIGIAQGGCTVGVITGVVGRAHPPEKRQQALALSGALGAAGQFYMMPFIAWNIQSSGWKMALLVGACMMLIVIVLAIAMTEPYVDRSKLAASQSAGAAFKEALGERSYLLLMTGYFVCGLQVVFIGVHLPAYLTDKGMNLNVAVMALALVAITNIFGTYWWGMQGAKYPKRKLLALIYVLRTVVILAFLAIPLSTYSVYAFAIAIGGLWLSTVPLTNGLVAQIFGVSYLSMLAGGVFFGHQLGSFVGVWMGGALFDLTKSYTIAWLVTAAFGIFAAIVHWPINETPLAKRREDKLAAASRAATPAAA